MRGISNFYIMTYCYVLLGFHLFVYCLYGRRAMQETVEIQEKQNKID